MLVPISFRDLWKEGSSMSNLGAITREQFEKSLQAFHRKSKELNDDWMILEFEQGQQKCHYLEKRMLCRCVLSVKKHNDIDTRLENSIEERDDCSLYVKENLVESEIICQFVFHVVYSASYGVPVLYFTASKPDGRMLSLEDIWANVPDLYRDRLELEKWTFVTQQEHPIVGRPFYQLHPCHTADLMEKVLTSKKDQEGCSSTNYIVSWLSFVGPVVRLKLSSKYGSVD